MEYNHREIERKWQLYWEKNKTFKTEIDHQKPKYYVLDMFPYPSGAGLHVGHPLGYIASDIVAHYMRHKGYNVLHPMGFDSFGLPAEQYAIETGQHPAITTERNIQRYKEQLKLIGLSYDWDREIRTSDPKYYKWTQWTFLKLFKHWYDKSIEKARPIDELINIFEREGNLHVNAAHSCKVTFTAKEWKSFEEKKKQEILMDYRLAYLSETWVNWCPALGTVLANDEVSEGYSIRGGYPVERKLMKQWALRITAYADRLLEGLDRIDWPESIKEMQRNWIGKSEGLQVKFMLVDNPREYIEIFTTRPDTIYGVTFMAVAPESKYVDKIIHPSLEKQVKAYLSKVINRSERERMADSHEPTGIFTGSYAINPFTRKAVPIWIADYVIATYGTGAVMCVPAHDQRDYLFAKRYGLPIIEVIQGGNISECAYEEKRGICINSGILNGLSVPQAIEKAIQFAEEHGFGKRTIQYKLRDAVFSRQRYWGEPFPIYYKDGVPYPLDEDKLPLELPEVDSYLPTEHGEPPLARAKNWHTQEGYPYETSTMPGFAGSSGYYLRFMDPHNDKEYFSVEAVNYWKNVDFYVGGAEHATGHLIYARFWNKFLYDLGMVPNDEPFKKLINQGMIQGRSNFVYRVKPEAMAEFILWELIKNKQLGVLFEKNEKNDECVCDFVCHEKKLYIDVSRHQSILETLDQKKNYAQSKGYGLLVFNLNDVILHTDDVIEKIKDFLNGQDIPVYEPMSIWEEKPIFVSKNIYGREHFSFPMHVDINLVHNDILDIEGFKRWRPEFRDAEFILEENGKYYCGYEIEKMSKSRYNVQNPDEIIEKYGADTLRMYEMFLGPVEQSKPWDTNGIEGVYRFLKKFWRRYVDENGEIKMSQEEPTSQEWKILHSTIKKITEDIERFSLNTCISTFMICVNELTALNCRKEKILKPLLILIHPFAPHIAEELWHRMGNEHTITYEPYPVYDEKYLIEDTIQYPVSFNGKMRFLITVPVGATEEEIKQKILSSSEGQKWLQGKEPKRWVIVPNKIINVVV
ncbi:MAG: class I tRNA ligase family protein [Bacteroidales bacterium]|nr:class I tRNA ligase family protein [Bacteroidales bacterium]